MPFFFCGGEQLKTTKRAKMEIYLEVLETIRKGIHKPTRIMYKTNLSWQPLMTILNSLTEQGLVTETKAENHSTFDITEKGHNILGYFSKAMESIRIV